MRTVEHYDREVVTVAADASVGDVAEEMRRDAVGCVVVVDERRHPLGIVTDRDLALRVVAAGRDAGATTAAAVMSQPVIAASPGDPIERVIERMSASGVRRVPVVDEEGVLTGLVTLDDLLVRCGSELADLGETARGAFRDARRVARLQQLGQEIETRFQGLREPLERLGGQAKDALLREFEELRERVHRSLH